MPPIKYEVELAEWIRILRQRVMYLYPPPYSRVFDKYLEIRPDERFNKVVDTHLQALLKKGKLPPAEISTAILNMADDIVAGREPVLRTGDYIALQTFVQGMK